MPQLIIIGKNNTSIEHTFGVFFGDGATCDAFPGLPGGRELDTLEKPRANEPTANFRC